MENEKMNQEKISPYKKKPFVTKPTLINILLFFILFGITTLYRFFEEKPQLLDANSYLSFISSSFGFMIVVAVIGFVFAYGIQRKKDSKEKNKHGLIYSIFIILLFIVGDVAMKIQEPKLNISKVVSEKRLDKYYSEDGKYSISFPGIPKSEESEIDNTSLGKIAMKNTSYYNGKEEYSVIFMDIDAYLSLSEEQVKQQLTKMRDGAIGNVNGSLLTSYFIKFINQSKNSYNGIYYVAEMKNKQNSPITIFGKIIVVKNRIYHITLVTMQNGTPKEMIDDFFDSFECFY